MTAPMAEPDTPKRANITAQNLITLLYTCEQFTGAKADPAALSMLRAIATGKHLVLNESEVAQWERDKARLAWLRQNWRYAHGTIFFENFILGPLATFDAAIDAALAAQTGDKP